MSLDVKIKRSLKGFSLDMAFRSLGGTLGILGASGCGKSMTLKCIAGIDQPDSGFIRIGGHTLFDSGCSVNLMPRKRQVGYLFQNYALFPHMRVNENIGCALYRMPKSRQKEIVADVIRRFHLEGLEDRYPGQLSGGQQQRVALARIFACEPRALLLDEPFSALDAHLKERLQLELLDLLRGYTGDVIIVTHSRDEVYQLCRRLLVMENGCCIAEGDTKALFRWPELLTVAQLTGCRNLSSAKPTGRYQIFAEDWGLTLTADRPVSADVTHVGIHAHSLYPANDGETNAFPVLPQETLETPFGSHRLFKLKHTGGKGLWQSVQGVEQRNPIPLRLAVLPRHVLLLRSSQPVKKS